MTLGIAVAVALVVGFILGVVKQIMYICRPNEVLFFSGRQHVLESGQKVGFRILIGGGRGFRVPLLETVDRMDLTNMEVEIKIQNAYSKGGIPLTVEAIANVKISDDQAVIRNAIERFQGRPRDEIRSVAKQTLEGHLRQVIANLTPEQMNSDRIQFAQSLAEEAEHDLRKLGLHLDTFNIHHVNDTANYLSSLGRSQIANVIREAEIAESNAQREAAQQEAKAQAEASVAQQRAEQVVTGKANELRQLKATLEAAAKSVEERAKANAETARATAEQELQKIRVELEGKRLNADVVARSEAENDAKAILARGAAAPTAERGRAIAASLGLMNQAWLEAGENANAILLIQQLDTVLRQIVERLDQIKIGSVTLVDSGDGTSLPNYIASYPATVGKILRELQQTVGIDVVGTLSAAAHGGNGEGV